MILAVFVAERVRRTAIVPIQGELLIIAYFVSTGMILFAGRRRLTTTTAATFILAEHCLPTGS